MRWLYVVLGVGVLAAALAVTTASLAGTAWSRTSMLHRTRILEGRVAPSPAAAAELPLPVVRFLDGSVPAAADLQSGVRLEQEGEFQTGEGEEGWRPFTAVQVVRAYPPAFQWDARIGMAPFTPVRVRDGYLDGQGAMTAKVWGLFSVVDAGPSPELARAALVRALAEAPWIPTRLLPGNGLAWSQVDDTTALATLTDGGLSVSATFAFDVSGDIVGVYVPDRGREVDGRYLPTPWVGRFWDHAVVDGGFRVPRQAEVAWIVDGERVPYWRGRVTSIAFWGPL